ncbi:hypothetical protein CL635_03360 [bacterium]|nr:hypothetical protein [bacterium]|tara:strand:- start:3875 stop:4813 length:939 start_codon:yes stop_codon:yes gene_type:complete
MPYTNVLVTGSISRDDIMKFPKKFSDYLHKDKLHKISVSFVVKSLEKQLGGTGTNISYNLKLASNAEVLLLAGIGKDNEDFFDFFKAQGIDTKGILVDNNLYTATGKVITDIDENQIWGFYEGAAEKAKEIDLKKFKKEGSILVISPNHPDAFLETQRQAINLSIPFMYDPGMALTWIRDEDLKTGVERCTWLIGNEYEIEQIERRTGLGKKELEKANTIRITTRGVKGVKYESKKKTVEVPVCKVTVEDPTGAGDAWRGGFLAGVLEEKPIEESLALGNALSSFAVETCGTVNHKPTKQEITERTKKILES